MGPQAQGAEATVRLTVLDAESRQPVPCRVHLKDGRQKPLKPASLPFWRDHFVCDGRAQLNLSAGRYSYEIERGPEYYVVTGHFSAAEDQSISITNELRRLADLSKEGWWSGETHVHRALDDVPLLMRAEDLHVAGVHSWWNNANPWANRPPPAQTVIRFDGNRFYDLMAGEDERGGGALLYFGFKQPLPVAGAKREFPPSMKFLRQARQQTGVMVDIEKPFWWDTPVWLASGLVDSIGIAHNHMQRDGVMDSEAWGRPRDQQRYPGPQGNGYYTQDLYYHILNCGLRIPPSAGSASGVLPNPVGYNRAYVQLDGELSYERWWEGLKAGRVFVSNGPLLRCRANGQWPGHVFKSDGPLQIQLQARLDSRDPIRTVELVRNGRAEPITLPASIDIQESGWFLVRAIASVTNTFRFASTGPWYVEIGAEPRPVQRESALLFRDWVRERMAAIKLSDPAEEEEAMQPLHQAEAFWQDKLAQAARTNPRAGPIPDRDRSPVATPANSRRPQTEKELQYWLDNMVRYLRFTPIDVSAATGLPVAEAGDAIAKYGPANAHPPQRRSGDPLRVLPYPGGRHPRIGFLEGAVEPQRETKISVFKQTLSNKVFGKTCVAVRSEDGQRWILTAWERCQHAWGNELVPCLHSDPQFPDCAPGETVRLHGWLGFYEGREVEPEFKRIEQLDWLRTTGR